MITRIQAQGLKCQPIDISLDRLNIITGANAVGKTAILDAIALAVLGYHPGLPKTGAGIMQLAAGQTLVVAATRSDGHTTLRWDRSASGSVKGPKLEGAAPAAMLDLRDYLDRPEAERARYVFARCQMPEGIDRNAVRKFLDGLPADTDAKRSAMKHIGKVIAPMFTATEKSKPLPEWLAALIKLVGDEEKAAKRIVKDGEGALRNAIEGMAGVVPAQEVDPEKVTEAMTALARARAKLEQMVADNEAASKARSQVARENQLLADLESDQSKADLREMLGVLQRSITKQEENLAGKSRSDVTALLRMRASACSQQEQARKRVHSFDELNAENCDRDTKILAQDRCPCCKQDGFDWKDSYMANSRAEAEKLMAKRAEAVSEATAAGKEIERIDGLILVARAGNEELDEAHNQLKADREDKNAIESKLNKIINLRLRIASVTAGPIHSEDAFAEAEREANHARTIAEGLTAEANEYNAWSTRKAEQARLELQQQEAEQVVASLSEVRKGLIELEAQLAERTIGPLLDVARRITRDTLGWDIEYRAGEFGYTRNGSWVGARTWSGMETRVGYAGLQMALAGQHPEKILLIDEMGVMTNDVKVRFVKAVADAINAGLIHQFVGIDIHAESIGGQYAAAGCNVITVG